MCEKKSQMELFENIPNPETNLLPQDGTVNYYGQIFNHEQANQFYQKLLETIDWKNDEAIIFRKKILTKRKVAWYGSEDFEYTYSKTTKKALPWTKELLLIKNKIEAIAEVKFTSVLLNRYRSGQDYVGWHADDEKELGNNPVIGSVNLGATRKFQLRRKDDKQEKFEVELQHGTLLIMRGATQHYWQHQVPKTAHRIGERLNLTFRVIE